MQKLISIIIAATIGFFTQTYRVDGRVEAVTPAPDDAEIILISGEDGNLWEFISDSGDYSEGDCARLIMWSRGTNSPIDDISIYAGKLANNADNVR